MKDDMTFAQKRAKHSEMVDRLDPLGWIPTGMFIFGKGDKLYDLSAADLDQIDRIEKDGLFVLGS